mgnify:CR=1 FL=1
MKLEQVLPQLRDGQTITRNKPYNQSATVLFLKIEDLKLKFKKNEKENDDAEDESGDDDTEIGADEDEDDNIFNFLLKPPPEMVFINGGEGSISHPTQALIDLMTIIDSKGSIDDLNIVIVGDLDHSRVTSSFIEGISNFSFNSLTFCGHPSMCSKYLDPALGRYEPDLDLAVQDADVIITLRIQHERFEEELNLDLDDYKHAYELTSERVQQARGDVIVMHPGPVNYIEISESVYQSDNSVIRNQVANGVAIRMAVLARYLSS